MLVLYTTPTHNDKIFVNLLDNKPISDYDDQSEGFFNFLDNFHDSDKLQIN